MPLVFAENKNTESGITYADQTGVAYQFPKRYRKLIAPGEAFIYYRGRKMQRGRQMPVYFGSGIVGNVVDDPTDDKRLVCEIVGYEPFAAPIPFKDRDNKYLEPGGGRSGYFQPGVRRISSDVYASIIDIASGHSGLSHVHGFGEAANREKSILRMVKTASQTVENSNGQRVLRTLKDKRLSLTHAELTAVIVQLLHAQNYTCALSELPFDFDETNGDPELFCSLDRIDSSGHYAVDNLQIVCRFVNRWKNADSDVEFRRLMKLLRSQK